MSLTRVVAFAAVLAASTAAHAEILKNAGRNFGAGAVEKIQPALVTVLTDAEARATALEDHIGVVGTGPRPLRPPRRWGSTCQIPRHWRHERRSPAS